MQKPSESEHGFCSMVFGPIWFTMHIVSLNYPVAPQESERKIYTQWFLNMGEVLPCSICKQNFKNNLKAIGFNEILDFANRTTFSNLVWRLHNYINKHLGKDVFVTFESFTTFYEQLRASDCSGDTCTRKSGPHCVLKFVPEGTVKKDEIFSIAAKCVRSAGNSDCLQPLKLSPLPLDMKK